MKEIERRVVKLESSLGLRDKPETVSEMFAAMQRGDYGPSSVMALVASILSNGRSVEHLRGGEIPDLLLDAFAECLKKSEAMRMAEEADSL